MKLKPPKTIEFGSKVTPYNIIYLQGLVNYQIQNLTFLSFQILSLTTNRKTGHSPFKRTTQHPSRKDSTDPIHQITDSKVEHKNQQNPEHNPYTKLYFQTLMTIFDIILISSTPQTQEESKTLSIPTPQPQIPRRANPFQANKTQHITVLFCFLHFPSNQTTQQQKTAMEPSIQTITKYSHS
jgi:hypothetical protein